MSVVLCEQQAGTSPELVMLRAGRPALWRRCGQIWGGDCPHPVGPPTWRHDDHPDLQQQKTAAVRSSSSTVLKMLGHRHSQELRQLVAANPACPRSTLRYLGRDRCWQVRAQVAANPACPPELLRQLAADRDPRVRQQAGLPAPEPPGPARPARRPVTWDDDPRCPAYLRYL
jgi:hypothetical protein